MNQIIKGKLIHIIFSFEDNKKGGKNLVPYFNIQFVATDEDFGTASVKLYLCSHDGNGEGFLGSASECSKSDKKARDVLKKITDQRNSIQVLVESVQTGTNPGDKIFRIMGHYEQLK